MEGKAPVAELPTVAELSRTTITEVIGDAVEQHLDILHDMAKDTPGEGREWYETLSSGTVSRGDSNLMLLIGGHTFLVLVTEVGAPI